MNYFISAIDTDAGKTMISGLIAKYFLEQGLNTITMKVSQTGCDEVSEDIEMHRKIMGIPMQEVDKVGITCPYIFKKPASPHLAAAKEKKTIDSGLIKDHYQKLTHQYDKVIVEGVGGLMVPLNKEELLIDMMQDWQLPVILVSSGKLGSINHTLLSLEVLKNRHIDLHGIIYNHYPITDKEITEDSCRLLKQYMKRYYPDTRWCEVPFLEGASLNENIGFSDFLI